MAEETTRVHQLCHTNQDEEEEVAAQEYVELKSRANHLRELLLKDESSRPLGKGAIMAFRDLDFNALVEMRRLHQTRQAAACARTKGGTQLEGGLKDLETERKKLIKRLHEVLKEEQDDIAVGTGCERRARWISAKGGQVVGTEVNAKISGNTANAISVATSQATKAAERRAKVFRSCQVPRLDAISTARVTVHRSLTSSGEDYAIILVNEELMVGRVIVMYSKSAAKNSKNESVDVTSNVSALSRIVIQAFEHTHGRQFRSIPSATARLQSYQYATLPPSNFLALLTSKPHSLNHSGFDLSPVDMQLFNELGGARQQLKGAMKEFRKRENK